MKQKSMWLNIEKRKKRKKMPYDKILFIFKQKFINIFYGSLGIFF